MTLAQLINRLKMRKTFLLQLDGQEVSGRKAVLSPFLHQNDESMTERESAEFESNNQEVFDQMRKNHEDSARFLK